MYPEPPFEDPRFLESEEYEESPMVTPKPRNILKGKIFRNVFSSDSDSECSNNEFDEIINDHRTTRFGCFDIHADVFLDSDDPIRRAECSNNEFDDIINDVKRSHSTIIYGCHDIHADDFLD